jgi:hypothetical protein
MYVDFKSLTDSFAEGVPTPAHVGTVITPPAPVAQNFGVGLQRPQVTSQMRASDPGVRPSSLQKTFLMLFISNKNGCYFNGLISALAFSAPGAGQEAGKRQQISSWGLESM